MRAPPIVLTSLLCISCVAVVQGLLLRTSPARVAAAATIDGDDGRLDVEESRASLAGRLLVAAPTLEDPYFGGTVIYMLADDEDGSLGVVLNRPRSLAGRDLQLWDGGPVGRDRVFVLHDDLQSDGSVVVGDVAVAAEPGVLDEVLQGRGPLRARIFVGYAGWGPRQLDGELAGGAWLVADADPMLVLSDDVGVTTARAYARAVEP